MRRAVSPPNTRGQRPSPNGLPSQPAINGKPRRVIGGEDDVESSTESVIRERALSPDQVRALSPPARGGTPTGPVSIESVVKPVQNLRSESPLIERERTKSPDTHIYGQQQQPNPVSANGLTSVYGAKTGSTGNVTTDPIRDVKVRDAELEMLRRREAWMKAALSQAMHAGFVYVNANLGDEDRGITDEQPKIAEAVITLKKLHGRIQVGKLAVSVQFRDVELCCLSFRRLSLNRHAMRRCVLVRPNSNGLVRFRRLRTTVRNLQP